jgi:hypothetical protein
MLDFALDVGDAPARITLVPGTVELLGGDPELYDESSGSVSPRFSCQRWKPFAAPWKPPASSSSMKTAEAQECAYASVGGPKRPRNNLSLSRM